MRTISCISDRTDHFSFVGCINPLSEQVCVTLNQKRIDHEDPLRLNAFEDLIGKLWNRGGDRFRKKEKTRAQLGGRVLAANIKVDRIE